MEPDFDPEIAKALEPLRNVPVDDVDQIFATARQMSRDGRRLVSVAAAIACIAFAIGAVGWLATTQVEVETASNEGHAYIQGASANSASEPSANTPSVTNPPPDEPATTLVTTASEADETCSVDAFMSQLDFEDTSPLADSLDALVAQSDMVISGQLVSFQAGARSQILVKPGSDELGRIGGALPSEFVAPRASGTVPSAIFFDVVLFAAKEGLPSVLPGGFFIACGRDDVATSVYGASTWATGMTLADLRASVWATQRGESTVTMQPTGDGTSIGRARLVDGSEFLVRFPTSEGAELTLTQAQVGGALAQLRSNNFTATIIAGFCTDEERTATSRGTVASIVRDAFPVADVSLCLPDLFVRTEIERIGDDPIDPTTFEVRPLIAGDALQSWMRDNMGIGADQCCYEGRRWVSGETLVVTGGWVDAVVRAYDNDSLAPLWQVDLVSLVPEERFGGEASFVWGSTPNGLIVVTAGHGFLYALEAQTGAVAWTLDVKDRNPVAYTGAPNGRWIITSEVQSEGDASAPVVQSIDPTTGTVLWTTPTRELTDLQWTSPVVLSDLVLIADVSSSPVDEAAPSSGVIALDVATGAELWRASLESRTEAFSSYGTIVADSTRTPPLLLVANVDGDVFRFDPEDGSQLWSADLSTSQIIGVGPDEATIITFTGRELDISLLDGSVR